MSPSLHVDNKEKDILILGKGPTQGLGEHSLTSEKMYPINLPANKGKNCLNLHYSGANSHLFANGTETTKFKAKDSEIVAKDSEILRWEFIMSRKQFERLVSR